MISVFEIPYLLTRPLADLTYTSSFLMQQCLMVIPFLLVVPLYKLYPTRYTVVLFLVWVALWCVWIIPLDRWDIVSGEHIQWLPYQLSKGIKLFLVPLLYSFAIKKVPLDTLGAMA